MRRSSSQRSQQQPAGAAGAGVVTSAVGCRRAQQQQQQHRQGRVVRFMNGPTTTSSREQQTGMQQTARRSGSPAPPKGTKFGPHNKYELMNCIAFSGAGNERSSAAWWLWHDHDSLSSSSSSSSDITSVSSVCSLTELHDPHTPVHYEHAREHEQQVVQPPEENDAHQVEINDENNLGEMEMMMKQQVESEEEPSSSGVSDPTGSSEPTSEPGVEEGAAEVPAVPSRAASRPSSSSLQRGGELRLLAAALCELETHPAPPPRSSASPAVSRPASSHNRSFTPEKVREITCENVSLLGRLQRARARGRLITSPPWPAPREASAAINRRQQQRQIQRENLILLRKITAARGSTGLSRVRRPPRGGLSGDPYRPSSTESLQRPAS